MTQATQPRSADTWVFRTYPKDIGVAIVFAIALALGWGLRGYTENRVTAFADKTSAFRVAYPATWGTVESLRGALLKVEDPGTPSAFKTGLTVERRGLDAQNPPTLQTLVDRRVAQQATLVGYHLLATTDTTIGGAKAMRQDYAYVVQPIDQPRRASLPVVVHASEYVVVTADSAFYITLTAPESTYASTGEKFDKIVGSIKVQ